MTDELPIVITIGLDNDNYLCRLKLFKESTDVVEIALHATLACHIYVHIILGPAQRCIDT
jgi:hypothetical protein